MRVVVEFEINEMWLEYMRTSAKFLDITGEDIVRRALQNVKPSIATIEEIRTNTSIETISDYCYYQGASDTTGEDY